MKRTISLVLVACMIFSILASLTSCSHFCIFKRERTFDNDYHWYECIFPGCTEKYDMQRHSLDAGVITREPTQELDGTITHACSICNGVIEKPLMFNGLDWTGWNEALSEDNFKNFTYKERAYAKAGGSSAITLVIYKFTEDEVRMSVTSGSVTKTESAKDEVAEVTKFAMIKSLQDMLKYGEFTYDRETKTYKLTGTMRIESLGVNAKTATLKFVDGKPAELFFTCIISKGGTTMTCESTVTLCDYGTTVID